MLNSLEMFENAEMLRFSESFQEFNHFRSFQRLANSGKLRK